jgi:uncharacterized protein (TIGR00297 family)
MSSFFLFSLAGVAILFVTLFIEFAIRKGWLAFFLGRKLLHFFAIGSTAWTIDQGLETYLLGTVLVALGLFLMVVLFKFKWWLQQETSYGIALFPIALGGLLMFGVAFYYVATAAWILAVSDASAGWIGRRWGFPKYIFLSETKSYQGALAFFVTALVCLAIRFPELHLGWWILLACLPTLTELFSWRGSDNFFLPIFTVGWIQLVLKTPYLNNLILVVCAVFFLAVLGWLVIHKKWLDQTGFWAAVWLAAILWMSGGWKAMSAPIFLLVFGSVAGRLFRASHASEKRTAEQVFSNGWVGVVLYMFYGLTDQAHWQLLAWCSFAISICDTISSEVGTAIRGKTFNIINFRVMQPGLSGGISVAGTTGGLVALLLLVTYLYFILPVTPIQLLWVAGTGMAGMLVDSILGSKLQALWKEGDQWSEITQAQSGAQLVKGLAWLDNHWVNFLSNGITMICAYLGYCLTSA